MANTTVGFSDLRGAKLAADLLDSPQAYIFLLFFDTPRSQVWDDLRSRTGPAFPIHRYPPARPSGY